MKRAGEKLVKSKNHVLRNKPFYIFKTLNKYPKLLSSPYCFPIDLLGRPSRGTYAIAPVTFLCPCPPTPWSMGINDYTRKRE